MRVFVLYISDYDYHEIAGVTTYPEVADAWIKHNNNSGYTYCDLNADISYLHFDAKSLKTCKGRADKVNEVLERCINGG